MSILKRRNIFNKSFFLFLALHAEFLSKGFFHIWLCRGTQARKTALGEPQTHLCLIQVHVNVRKIKLVCTDNDQRSEESPSSLDGNIMSIFYFPGTIWWYFSAPGSKLFPHISRHLSHYKNLFSLQSIFKKTSNLSFDITFMFKNTCSNSSIEYVRFSSGWNVWKMAAFPRLDLGHMSHDEKFHSCNQF